LLKSKLRRSVCAYLEGGHHMSHYRIFQIKESPILMEGYIKEQDFSEHWFVGSVADSVSDECDRSEDILSLMSLLEKKNVAEFDGKGDPFRILPSGKEAYFAKAYECFVEARRSMLGAGLAEFASSSDFAEAMRLMCCSFDEEHGYYVSPNTDEIFTFDQFIRYSEIGKRYYIGGTLDYHY
jgi:hypothetical protein